MEITEDQKNEIVALFKLDDVFRISFYQVEPNVTEVQWLVTWNWMRSGTIEEIKLRLYCLQDGSQFYVGEYHYQEGEGGRVKQIIVVSEKK